MTDKRKIMYDYNAKDCEQCNTDSVCCYCKNMACYKLEEELKRKEQECEELKDKLRTKARGWANVNDQILEEVDQLKVENEELKQFLSKEPLAIQALQKSYESYQKSTKVFSDWVKDYKQLLTEIKEIAENREIFCENCGGGVESFTCDDCGYVKILQKISECEGNDDNK
jgi:predicted RNase H-like nuclease (RuvC/YqgF family)